MNVNQTSIHDGERLQLVCPVCRKPLVSQPGAWTCAACARRFPIIAGFPDLVVGERFDDPSDAALLAYEEGSNADLTRHYWQPLFKRLWPAPTRPPRLLSVGCGTGVDVDLLRAAGYESVGIDCGNRTAVWPRRKAIDYLLLANGKHLPFPDNSFDAAFCGCVFPHVGVVGDSNIPAPDVDAQRRELAHEMARVVRPGGYIVVSSPNRWFPFDIFHGRTPGSYTPRFNPPSARFLLSVGDYTRLFSDAGCRRARPLPVENYWGFVRSKHTLRGWLLGLPVRFIFWLTSRKAFAWLRGSVLSPWLVVLLEKKDR